VTEYTVSVIAGGWSLIELGVDGRDRIPGHRIGVNDAFTRLRCDTGISMDRLWVENRWTHLKKLRRPFWASRNSMRNIGGPSRQWLQEFDYDIEALDLSTERGHLNGRNSGHCGLNLAYQIAPKRIVLWGFDMGRGPAGETYWHEPYVWAKASSGNTPAAEYARWAARFLRPAEQCAQAGITLLNASPHSQIIGIPRVDPWSLLT